MLLNLNSKFKFFLTTTFLFSSPDTLALHLSVSIDDKESPISESLIIKDVIAIGAVPFSLMITEFPEFNGGVNGIPNVTEELPEFNGAVNGIPNVTEELPEFNGAVNGIPEDPEELPEFNGAVNGIPAVHELPEFIDPGVKVPVPVDHEPDVHVPGVRVPVDHYPDVSIPDIPVRVSPVADKVVADKVVAVQPPVNSIPNVTEELPEFNGAVNGIPNVTEELPEFNGAVNGIPEDPEEPLVVTYVSITAVPANAPIMDKPEYVEPHQPLSQRKLEENNSILLKHQFNKLRSLQTYCIANKKEFCYGIRHHYMAKNDIHDNLLGLRLGYGITNKLTLGGNIERSLEHHLSNNYRTLHNNVGIGAFVHYKLPSNSYIVAGIAKNNNSYLAPPILITALPDIKAFHGI
ncbi:SIALI-17 repeat-containing surface protein [Haemophilus haemolyticus]|uniref:Uncharacterized protein n=1 Tax=Haemophilus haemolyticus TaxID=726 RepID=A0A852PWW5_HAEHA|nr:SIALI-17 repeat-containing surface protein [Haemophilus haemolyticus]NYA27982.1 hypothetical protein [Haemophilus haemolyticus]